MAAQIGDAIVPTGVHLEFYLHVLWRGEVDHVASGRVSVIEESSALLVRFEVINKFQDRVIDCVFICLERQLDLKVLVDLVSDDLACDFVASRQNEPYSFVFIIWSDCLESITANHILGSDLKARGC